MVIPKHHPRELRRIQVLRLYKILDTESERSFDELTRLASEICETPIGIVSLVDKDRQWFKSKVGTDLEQTARDISFCGHAILQEGLFIVPDASKDDRFRDNPLVTSGDKIRFYAGTPLIVKEGVPVGTLCVIDRVPRQLTEQQSRALATLGRAVVSHMELRRTIEEINSMSSLLSLCAWCRKVNDRDDHWVDLDSYVHQTEIITHGICPDCQELMRREAS